MRSLGVFQTQGPRECVEHPFGWLAGSTLLEAYVVVDADPCQLAELLAA